jgi:hypothetical protein
MGNKLTALCRIKPLPRLDCCALPVLRWGGAGASGSEISAPVLSAPGSPELREAGLARGQ